MVQGVGFEGVESRAQCLKAEGFLTIISAAAAIFHRIVHMML